MQPTLDGRYSRQELFPPIGPAGQEKIRNARVCIVGCGALGSFQAEALARAGVGSLRLIDRDTIDSSNLQRQWLYTEHDAKLELPKAAAARNRLAEINSEVPVEAMAVDFTPENATELVEGQHLILDGTDNFETRFLINDISVAEGIPWIYGAAVGSYGAAMPIDPTRGPCFRCIYPDGPQGSHPTCELNGVIASATASVAALQTAMALRMIVGWPDFKSRLHSFDIWKGVWRTTSAGERDPECAACGKRDFEWLNGKSQAPVSLCGRNAVQMHVRDRRVDLGELAQRLKSQGDVRLNDFALRVALPKYDVTIFPDGRAIIRGTTDIPIARGIYAKLIGA